MSLVYIGYYCDQNYFDQLKECGIRELSQARQNLEGSLLKGLLGKKAISKLISYVPYSSKMNCPDSFTYQGEKIENICVPRSFKGIISGAKQISRILAETEQGSTLLMYAINPMFVIPAFLLRRKKKFKVITICSELPQYRRWKERLKVRLKHKLQGFLNKRFDGYILLTEQMKQVIPIVGNNYMVMEGIYSGGFGIKTVVPRNKSVMYAGGLTEDNGIKIIIEGFKESDADELWILGAGPLEQYVREEEMKDGRIKYYGSMDVNTVREMEKQAYALLCVRDSQNPLTKYSFPSKVLEYLASGTIVIASKLNGIPEEYYDYLFRLDDYKAEALTKLINQCIEMPQSNYLANSSKQVDFVKKNKMESSQAQRVLKYIGME